MNQGTITVRLMVEAWGKWDCLDVGWALEIWWFSDLFWRLVYSVEITFHDSAMTPPRFLSRLRLNSWFSLLHGMKHLAEWGEHNVIFCLCYSIRKPQRLLGICQNVQLLLTLKIEAFNGYTCWQPLLHPFAANISLSLWSRSIIWFIMIPHRLIDRLWQHADLELNKVFTFRYFLSALREKLLLVFQVADTSAFALR